jgi:hypothetical protein
MKRWETIIGCSAIVGIILGIVLHIFSQPYVFVREAQAATVIPTPKPMPVTVEYTPTGIERLIRNTFPEDAETALAIARNEGGLQVEIQSQYRKNGVREPSFCTFQIHEPSWMKLAKSHGYGDYKTNVESCVKMARIVYDTSGWKPWTTYTSGSYKQYLSTGKK